MNLQDFARELEAKQRARRAQLHARPWHPSATPATSLGYACERRTVYQRTQAEKGSGIGDELASIFEEGNLHQTDVRLELAKLGYEVVEQEVNFKDRALDITGTIDGKIMLPSPDGSRPRRVPVEIKSTAGSPPTTDAEWRNSEAPLMARYYAQLQTYLYLSSEPEGLGLFKDKLTGLWTVVAVALDYEYAEGILKRAERIRDATRAWLAADTDEGREAAMPSRLPDRSECSGCPFRDSLCHPEQAEADPLLLAEDPGLAAQIDRRQALDPVRRDFEKIDEAIKTRFRLTKGDKFVVNGRWLVKKKPHGKGIRIDIGPLAPETEGAA